MSTYEKFIEANNKLRECFEGVKPKAFESMSPFEQENVCGDEKTAVRDFLSNGSLSFRSLVQERIDILDKAAK